MVQTPVRQITLEEFLALPETKPASEYIDGQIIQKPMPQGHHSIIQGELLTELTLVETARIPTNAGQIENVFTTPPDWTIEILSPGQSANKVLKNINHCLAAGTQMGWLIDPEDRSVVISRIDRNLEVIDEPSAMLPVPDFAKSLELTVDRLFGWLNVL
jgi:Uma2 family endonuclease